MDGRYLLLDEDNRVLLKNLVSEQKKGKTECSVLFEFESIIDGRLSTIRYRPLGR